MGCFVVSGVCRHRNRRRDYGRRLQARRSHGAGAGDRRRPCDPALLAHRAGQQILRSHAALPVDWHLVAIGKKSAARIKCAVEQTNERLERRTDASKNEPSDDQARHPTALRSMATTKRPRTAPSSIFEAASIASARLISCVRKSSLRASRSLERRRQASTRSGIGR